MALRVNDGVSVSEIARRSGRDRETVTRVIRDAGLCTGRLKPPLTKERRRIAQREWTRCHPEHNREWYARHKTSVLRKAVVRYARKTLGLPAELCEMRLVLYDFRSKLRHEQKASRVEDKGRSEIVEGHR